MTAIKTKNRKHSIILAVLLCALVCYFVATLISLQSKVNAAEETDSELSSQCDRIEDENKSLKEIIANGNEADYIERIAREQYGYAKPEERVYYDSALS